MALESGGDIPVALAVIPVGICVLQGGVRSFFVAL